MLAHQQSSITKLHTCSSSSTVPHYLVQPPPCSCFHHASSRQQHGRIVSTSSSSRVVASASSLGQNDSPQGGSAVGLLHSLWPSKGLLPGSTSSTSAQFASQLDNLNQLTRILLALSVVPAALLAVQPLAVSQSAAGVVDSLAWQGPLRDMFSFTVLLGVFIGSEPAAALASAVSAAGGAVALVCHSLPLPTPAVATVVLLVAAAACTLWDAYTSSMPASQRWFHQQQQQQQQLDPSWVYSTISDIHAKPHALSTNGPASSVISHQARGHDDSNNNSSAHGSPRPNNTSTATPMTHSHTTQQQQQQQQQLHVDEPSPSSSLLSGVQQLLGVLGGGLLLQFWYGLVRGPAQPGHTDAAWVLPVVVGAAAVLVAGQALKAAEASGALQLQALRDDWPAWSATLLLILQPLHQLVDTALHPAQLVPDSSVGQLVLLLLANGLMVPRALFTRQFMMFTGTCSGALLAAGQLLMVALHSISCTLRLPTAALGASSAALASSGSAWSVPFGVLMHLHSSRDGCMLSGTCGLPALTVAALVVWLWLCLAVLHQGWQWIKAHQ